MRASFLPEIYLCLSIPPVRALAATISERSPSDPRTRTTSWPSCGLLLWLRRLASPRPTSLPGIVSLQDEQDGRYRGKPLRLFPLARYLPVLLYNAAHRNTPTSWHPPHHLNARHTVPLPLWSGCREGGGRGGDEEADRRLPECSRQEAETVRVPRPATRPKCSFHERSGTVGAKAPIRKRVHPHATAHAAVGPEQRRPPHNHHHHDRHHIHTHST